MEDEDFEDAPGDAMEVDDEKNEDKGTGNNGAIPILRFHAMDDGEGNLLRLKAGLVNRPPLLWKVRDQGRMMPGDAFGIGKMVPGNDANANGNADAAFPGGCGGGRGGCGHGGRGGGGDPDPVGDYIDPNLSLASVGGLPQHVSYLRRAIIYPLVHKDAFKEWGIEPPKGILFHGPPGTGKTLLAMSMANEIKKALGGAKITFFYQKGCETNSQYFGESEENLRGLFNRAIENKPSIIFFDEIDGLCPDRDKAGQVSEAYVGVVTALLGLIDSIKRGEVFLIGATNRLDAVDAAIRRPGRFDKDLAFQLPDVDGRKMIIGIHTRQWFKNAPDEELRQEISHKTIGFSGADIQQLCRNTLGEAITRCGNVPAAQITVTPEDWTRALEGMTPSRSDVFGSTVVSAKPPLFVVLPLIQTVVNEIVLKLQLSLPNGEVYPTPIIGMRSFVVWEQELESEVYLHHCVVNGVLSHPALSKIPIFALDKEHLAERVNNGSTPVKAAGDIIRQAATSNKPCVLLVPGINWINNEIARFTREESHFTFVQQLLTLAGSQAILFASFIGRLQDISPDLKSLFTIQSFYAVRKPDKEERTLFFQQIFADLIIISEGDGEPEEAKRSKSSTNVNVNSTPAGLTPELSKKFEKQLEISIDVTINNPCDNVLKLFDTLKNEKVQQKEFDGDGNFTGYKYDELHRRFLEILDLYARTRLAD